MLQDSAVMVNCSTLQPHLNKYTPPFITSYKSEREKDPVDLMDQKAAN